MHFSLVIISVLLFSGSCFSELLQVESENKNLVVIFNGKKDKIDSVVKKYSTLIKSNLTSPEKRLCSWYYYRALGDYKKFVNIYTPEERARRTELFSKKGFVKQFSNGVNRRTNIRIEFSFDYKGMVVFMIKESLKDGSFKKYIVMMINVKNEGWCFTNKFVSDPIYPLFNNLLSQSEPKGKQNIEGYFYQFGMTDTINDKDPYIILKVTTKIPSSFKKLVSGYAQQNLKGKYLLWDKNYYPPDLGKWDYFRNFGNSSSIESYVGYNDQTLLFCKLKNKGNSNNILISVIYQDKDPVFSLNNSRDPIISLLRDKFYSIEENEEDLNIELQSEKHNYSEKIVLSVPVNGKNKGFKHLTFSLSLIITSLPEEKVPKGKLKTILEGKKYFTKLDCFYPFFKDTTEKEFRKYSKDNLVNKDVVAEIKKALVLRFNDIMKSYQAEPRIKSIVFDHFKWSN